MRDIYIKDPDGEPEYDGEEDNEEYEESMEELRFLCDSYNWQHPALTRCNPDPDRQPIS